ncbi:hypothetical protein PanWU01x14_197550 [Parasponia andersonii]|uniref:Uncharacterized protein n=1 Tax=Parasponia andersonii TaxID=3476 RepID=A0A2P5BZ52_PARAD|nr:hypothetical protein PanWU01x14_197550 [Parasponia andersonii]
MIDYTKPLMDFLASLPIMADKIVLIAMEQTTTKAASNLRLASPTTGGPPAQLRDAHAINPEPPEPREILISGDDFGRFKSRSWAR